MDYPYDDGALREFGKKVTGQSGKRKRSRDWLLRILVATAVGLLMKLDTRVGNMDRDIATVKAILILKFPDAAKLFPAPQKTTSNETK